MIRWGILSTGRITEEFVKAVRAGTRSEVTAIASRDAARAAGWANKFGVGLVFGSYDELLVSPQVDAVYIALPNSMHADWTIRALESGKHVLCEKPMALSTADIDTIISASNRTGRLVMEGYMFLHHPVTKKAIELAANGSLGSIITVRAWHGFTVEDSSTDIRYSAELGGGGLADLGCYCIAGALMVIPGKPVTCTAKQVIGPSGVDESTYALLGFDSGSSVMLDCSMRYPESAGLQIVGEKAQVEIPQPWFPHLAPHLWLVDRAGRRDRVECQGADSYALEVESFCRAVAGEVALAVPHDLSRRVAETLTLIASAAVRVDSTGS
jgi:D-xylose 1-dehydrogenase (NADP+, D-xylono-1,5-lactone-forming)